MIIPKEYKSTLTIHQTQIAIGELKRIFEKKLSLELNLKRVSAPLFVEKGKGLQDDLSGKERSVEFDIPSAQKNGQVVHSLAKWKRIALHEYGFTHGEGIFTNMNAIRRDEELDEIHSIYVDQWDWEKVISKKERNINFLKQTVANIVDAIVLTQKTLKKKYKLKTTLSSKVTYISSQELEDLYPNLTPKQREREFTKLYKTVFIMQIGGKLKSNIVHDGRAPDYDDWSLNGDILFWSDVLNREMELSSMGIRVDKEALEKQLKLAGCEERAKLFYHKMLLEEKLPLTIGGGIGRSRLSMLLLEKAHIAEVQTSIWSNEILKELSNANIFAL